MGDPILLLKLAHLLGAILLLGNVVVTGFWAFFLYRRRPAVPFRPVAQAILRADLLFTFLGGTLLATSGIGLVIAKGYLVRYTPWLVHGIGALVLSTVLWLAVLLPDQWRLARLDPADAGGLNRVFRRWTLIGWATTAVLFYGLWAMVVKG